MNDRTVRTKIVILFGGLWSTLLFFYLSVGYGLEGTLPDVKVGRMMDEIAIPYLGNEQPDLAIMEAYKTYYNEIAAEYGGDGEVAPVTMLNSGSSDSGFGIPFPVLIFIAIYIIFRILGIREGAVIPSSSQALSVVADLAAQVEAGK